MNRSFVRFVLGAVTMLFFVLGNALSAQALSLSPSIIDERIQPGETKTILVTVVNDETAPIQLEAALQKFLPLGMSGQQQFLPPTDLTGLPSWTFVGIDERVLQPGEKQVIPIQLQIPADATTGGAYEAVFFSGRPLVGQADPGVGIRSRIGVLVLLTIGDATTSELTLSDWRVSQTARTSLSGIVHATLRNAGRTHTIPNGEFVVRSFTGKVVARIPLNPERARILPASERVLEGVIGVPASENAGWFAGLRNEIIAFGLGRHQITLEGVDGLSVSTPLSLTVWPWRIIEVVIGGVLLLVIGLRLYRRRLIRALEVQK